MKFVDPKNDAAFLKIFGKKQCHDIVIEFLNAILDLPSPIQSVKVTIPFSYPLVKGLEETILDVHACDQDDNKFIVEMQVEGASGFDKRIVYYSSKAYVSGLPKGKLYRELKPVIFLGILNFTLFDNAHYISRHLILNKETGTHELKDLEFNFIELPKFNKEEHECKSLTEKWIYFLKNADNLALIPPNSTTPALQHAYECASEHIWSKEELDLYDYRSMQIDQEWGRLDFAMQRGMERGMEKGMEKGLIKVATSLLDILDDDTISKKTGLPIDTIRQLRHHRVKP